MRYRKRGIKINNIPEILTYNKRQIATLLFSAFLGICITTIPLDSFWVVLAVFLFCFIILCKFKFGLYLLVPLIMLESQKLLIRTSNSLSSDFVGIYFPVFMVVFIGWVLTRLAKLPIPLKEASLNIDLFVFLFLGWATITLFWTPNFEHGLIQYIRFAANILIFYMFANAVSSDVSHKRIMNIMLVTGLIIAIAAFLSITIYRIHDYIFLEKITRAIYLKLTFFVYWVLYHPRAMGIVPHNTIASLLNLVIALTFMRFVYDKRMWFKVMLFLCMVTLTFAHLYTMSRGGLAGYLSMWFFFLAGVPLLRKNFFRNVSFFILTFIPIFLIALWKVLFSPRFSASSAEATMQDRIGWWMMGLRILQEKYAGVGMGIGGFKYYLHPLDIPHAHNIYLSILFDFGIVGFIIFIVFIIYLARNLYDTMKRFQPSYIQLMLWGCAGGLLALGVHGLVDVEYNIAAMWFCIGLTVATLRMSRKELGDSKTGGLT